MSDLPAAADLALARAGHGAGSPLRVPAHPTDADAARQAAESFEATFIGQMLEPMFQGLSTDGPFGGGQGEQIFRSMLITHYGEQIARRGGFGIADQVMAEMIRIQEAQESPQRSPGSARVYAAMAAAVPEASAPLAPALPETEPGREIQE